MALTVSPIGVNDITAISRRLIMPKIADNVYLNNPTVVRLTAMGKIEEQGGFQIEQPVIYADIQAGGAYSGYAVLDVAPNDTIFNLAFPWAQYYTAVSFSGLDLARADGPDPVAALVKTKLTQAGMSIRNRIGQGMWSYGANADDMTGIPLITDNGTLSSTYGGVSRLTYPFLNAQIDSSTTTLTFAKMQTLFGECTFGGRSPSIMMGTQSQYNVYWGLLSGGATAANSLQRMPVQPGGTNEQLAQAGFSNVLFNGVPFLTESHIPATTSVSGFVPKVVFMNEDYLNYVVHSRVNLYLDDFQTPVNQDAMTAKILHYCQLISSSPQTFGAFTALTG